MRFFVVGLMDRRQHLLSDAASWMTLVTLTGHGFPKELRIELIDASGFLGVIRSSFHDVL